MFNEDYSFVFDESKQFRESRKVSMLVLSGVVGGTRNTFTEEIVSGTNNWVTISGVLSLNVKQRDFRSPDGSITPRTWMASFDYNDIKGYENCRAIFAAGRPYNIKSKSEDYFAGKINHIDFELVEGNQWASATSQLPASID